MAEHGTMRFKAKVAVYFAHPHSPWELGTNQNTSRWLREYSQKCHDYNDPGYL